MKDTKEYLESVRDTQAKELTRLQALNAELLENLKNAVSIINGYQIAYGAAASNQKILGDCISVISNAGKVDYVTNSQKRIKSLESAGSDLLQAMNQYSFFLNGYGNGSASLAEVNHANDEVFKAQNVLFELLKTQ